MDKSYFQEAKRTIYQLLTAGAVIALCFAYNGEWMKMCSVLVGVATGIAYYLMMWRRILCSANMPIGKAVNYMRAGGLIRLFFVLLVLLLAAKTPHLDFWAVVVGLLLLQGTIFLNLLLLALKEWLRRRLQA